MASDLVQKVRKVETLPALPATAVEVLRLTGSEEATADELTSVVEKDPALTAKILKVANSPLYGIQNEITSLAIAIRMLGLRTVKVLALSVSITEGLTTVEVDGFDHQIHWRKSLTMAVAARLLAKACSSQLEDEAFIVGLLSNIGILVCNRLEPRRSKKVFKTLTTPDSDICETERKVLGVTHAEISQELLSAWSLPEKLCQAVGAHHGDGIDALQEPTRPLAKIARAAANIADLFCQEEVDPNHLERVRQFVRDETDIDEVALESLLEELEDDVKQMASVLSLPIGDQSFNYAEFQASAAIQLVQLSMEAEVERAETTKRAEDAELHADRLEDEKRAMIEIASTDGLTKLANRAAFDKRLEEELERAQLDSHSIGLILLDIDHFKMFNDTYGHQAGDEVLRMVGATLDEVGKKVGFAARYGGEEFAVIIPDKQLSTVHAVADLIRRQIEGSPVEYDGRGLQVTASIGIVVLNPTEEATTEEDLIKRADRCLYHAKRSGRNRVVTAA